MYCQNCGTQTDSKFCPNCGAPMGGQSTQTTTQTIPQPNQGQMPTIIINNTNTNTNVNKNENNNGAGMMNGRMKNKWVALLLCIFLGLLGAHKFYEGKIGMGILYLLTAGLFCIGWIIDIIAILGKPNPYYV